jgi:hypothetical protein
MSDEMVDHPQHYNAGRIEVIDALEDWKLPPNLWQAVKYIARAPHKNKRLEDLRKAEWYLHREIQMELYPELSSKQAQTREQYEANARLQGSDPGLVLSMMQVGDLDRLIADRPLDTGQRLMTYKLEDRARALLTMLSERLRSHK